MGAGIGEGYKIAVVGRGGVAGRREGGHCAFCVQLASFFPVTGGGNVERIIWVLCNNFVLFCISEKMNFYSVVKMLPKIQTMCLALSVAGTRDPVTVMG